MTIPRWLLRFFWLTEYGEWGIPNIPEPGTNVGVCLLLLRLPIFLWWCCLSPIMLVVWAVSMAPEWAMYRCPWRIKVK